MTRIWSCQVAPLARRTMASSPCRRISILEGWCGTNLDDVVGAFSVTGMLATSDIATASGFSSSLRADGASYSSGILGSSKTTALAPLRISGAAGGGGFPLALPDLPFARTRGKGEVDPAGIADQLAAQFDEAELFAGKCNDCVRLVRAAEHVFGNRSTARQRLPARQCRKSIGH